jgi:hypothetical protein
LRGRPRGRFTSFATFISAIFFVLPAFFALIFRGRPRGRGFCAVILRSVFERLEDFDFFVKTIRD